MPIGPRAQFDIGFAHFRYFAHTPPNTIIMVRLDFVIRPFRVYAWAQLPVICLSI